MIHRSCYGLIQLVTVLLIASSFFLGCDNCDENYDICTSKVSPLVLETFSYDYTCMYPTMTVGDAQVYCECQADYRSCKKK
jgi:hypothetical protein